MAKYDLRRKISTSRPVKKVEFICNACKGKMVLDLGCVRHSADFALADPEWLHKKIKAVARNIVGVDYLPQEVKKLNAAGYDIIYGDVTKPIELESAFDVIVAGDLIEHLTNFEAFFENCTRLLKPDGMLILSTPNPFYSGEFHYVAFKGDYLINPEHTCWIDPQALLQLMSRFDFVIDEIHFIKDSWKLSNIICNSEANEYDILNGRWPNNAFLDKVKRRLVGLVFGLFYIPFRFLTGGSSDLVKHSDYLVVARKR